QSCLRALPCSAVLTLPVSANSSTLSRSNRSVEIQPAPRLIPGRFSLTFLRAALRSQRLPASLFCKAFALSFFSIVFVFSRHYCPGRVLVVKLVVTVGTTHPCNGAIPDRSPDSGTAT